MEDFFWHARLAHHQERAFNNAIDNLPANGILILTDYSMNYSHEHQDAEGAEWWSPFQSTLLPVIVYVKDATGKVWAESRCVSICGSLAALLCLSLSLSLSLTLTLALTPGAT